MQPAAVLALDPDPRAPKATLVLKDGRAVWAPLHHAAIQPEIGDEVLVLHDHPDGPHVRMVLPLGQILPELQTQGLLRELKPTDFQALVAETFSWMDEPPEALDGPDILSVLRQHYGREDDEPPEPLIAEDALERAVRDRILVFADSNETPDLVEDTVAALADALVLDVRLAPEPDFNDAFDALGEALRNRADHAFLLPIGVNDTAILVRDELAPSRLTLFIQAERAE